MYLHTQLMSGQYGSDSSLPREYDEQPTPGNFETRIHIMWWSYCGSVQIVNIIERDSKGVYDI